MPILFYSLIAIFFLISLRKRSDDGFMDKQSSNVIKGFFIFLIVFSHVLNQFPYQGFLSVPLNYFRSILGQLIVSMFFFISGFGIILSIKKKGKMYSRSLVTNRLLRIVLYTIFLLIPFYIYSAVIGNKSGIFDYLLSFIGLKSFGNETWFILAILVCYAACSVVFFFNYKNLIVPIILTSSIILIYIIVMLVTKQPSCTWDTIVCFPFGMFAGIYYDNIKSILSKKRALFLLIISIVIVPLLQYGIYAINLKQKILVLRIIEMLLANAFFCLFFVCLTRIFVLKSHVLGFCGKASYAFFLMHRLIICIFSEVVHLQNSTLNYFVVFTLSIAIGIPFFFLCKLLDKYIINPIVDMNIKRIKIN